ncbi:sensor histidine kinase [Rhodococcus sp. NPDC127528]|uniref:sensor histidine kinase n=1 Tax=unclassified Rhodococcus (in: high G+C Gram-positive bacteria) TaxID=192944 RepID=UPI003624DC03
MTFTDFLRAPVAAKTWREAGYLAASSAVAFIGFTYLFVGTIFGTVLVVTLIGIPLLAAMIVGARGFGLLHRRLGAALLRLHVEEPPAFAPRPGVLGFVRSCLTDRTGWRAVLFVLIKSVLSVVSVFGALLFTATAAFLTASPLLWWLVDPVNVDGSGTPRHSIAQFGDVYFDTWPEVLALSAVGIVGLFLAPWPIRWLASLDRTLIQLLLGPSPRDRRVEELERSRSAAVEDSATRLRRVERDLHDGTQARLVAMAMTLGRAEERIATGQDPSDLVHDAHSAAKDALVELREMVRGIHPPALDLGLGPALETLSARSAVPVELSVAIDPRPSRGTETIAYFTVAELLTNTARHSSATRAWVSARSHGDSLSVVVRDNGVGGAVVGAGSGLAGLAARAGTVDGSLLVDSPVGGPTVVTLRLPVDGKH